MADDDPFADLGETLEDEPDDEPQDTDEASEPETTEETSPGLGRAAGPDNRYCVQLRSCQTAAILRPTGYDRGLRLLADV